jgi:hypothetical protein
MTNNWLNPIRIQQVKYFLDIWRVTQLLMSPQIHPLEIAIAMEQLASQIRREEAEKAARQNSPLN